ncbi:AI-2E family transporter [Limibacter armeniacum]|uniref:AI-2E family transporter n=1 Tax=Limibacter armeniacum TaxID=466084 RepID=UPI002FE6B64C
MKDERSFKLLFGTVVEITVRLAFLFILIGWCFRLLSPFMGVVLWGIILAIATRPVYDVLYNWVGNRTSWATACYIILGLIIILLPSWLFLDSMIGGILELKERVSTGTLSVPPPPDKVKDWPVVGSQLYEAWTQANLDLNETLDKYESQFKTLSETIASKALNTGVSVLQFVISLIISGVLLTSKGSGDFSKKFFRRLVGEEGDEYEEVTVRTVRNVTKGVLGVAFIQAFLVGIGFVLAGVPYAGVWTLIVLIFAILQLPATLVIIPVIIYLFSHMSSLGASLWSIYLIAAGISDNVLKPILLGKGAPVPMLVIFLGVIGGFILSGFLGLFTGAIVLSLGYKLFMTWVDNNPMEEETENLSR